jgi:hypothetical protein
MRLHPTLAAVALLCCACFGFAFPSTALAAPDTSLDVALGWGDHLKAGRWGPITVQVSNPKVQGAVLEVYAPQGGAYAMVLQQYFTLGPATTTLQVYAPLRYYGGESATVVIRNADSGKALARYPPESSSYMDYHQRFLNQSTDRLVGVSGARTSLDAIRGQVQGIDWQLGHLPQYLLPRAPVGYDSLDLLLLNKADLIKVNVQQQKAIVDWVRAGGNLLLWPGDDPIPTTGPLIQALPCRIEGPVTVEFDKQARQELGLPDRVAGVRARKLVPNPDAGDDAELLALFPRSSGGEAYRRRLGLGRIVVTPIDLAQLPYEDPAKTQVLWSKVLDGMGVLPNEAASDPTVSSAGYYSLDAEISRQAVATNQLMNLLGNVPGAGRFGFAYVAYVLLGMMVVVGPLDWFVLKKLGRQPWTWVTTAGWIGLITFAAVFAGHLIKSGQLHYRTVQLVDQVGGQTVGDVTLGCVYSPKTTEYQLLRPQPTTQPADTTDTAGNGDPVPPDGWWVPATSEGSYSRHGLKNDMAFRQNDSGNYPGPMLINVWNMRFTRGEVIGPGAAVIEAKLAVEPGEGGLFKVSGTIKNLGSELLTNVRVRTKHGFFSPADARNEIASPLLPRLEPGATAPVSGVAAAKSEQQLQPSADEMRVYRNRYGYQYETIPENAVWQAAQDLAGGRSVRIERLLATGKFAVVYAEVPDPSPAAVLREAGAVQKHYKIVRAVVPLNP